MNPENRVWLASILSAVVLVIYAQLLSRASRQEQPTAVTPRPQEIVKKDPGTSPPQLKLDEEVIVLESKALRLEVGKSSVAVRSVVLKDFRNVQTKSPLKLGETFPVLFVGVGNAEGPALELVEQSDLKAAWRGQGETGILHELSLELDQEKPTFRVTLQFADRLGEKKIVPVRIVASWNRSDKLSSRYNLLEAVFLTEKQRPWQKTHLRYLEGLKQPRTVPRGTSMATLSERYFCQSIKPAPGRKERAILLPAPSGTIAAAIETSITVEPNSTASASFVVYAGPRDFFRLQDAGFAQAFPLGFLGQIGLALMLLLKGIAGMTHNYGTAIIILAGLVTVTLSPFTLISFRSMKKLQELQPKIEQIKKRHDKDPKRVNQELMALFKEHRVSPLSGCLPMFLQLPVFFALWSAISHVIELRGKTFLWIKDLSLPDRLARLPFGLDLNILPILMAIAMYLQSKTSQVGARPSGATSLFSGPLMSVLFGVMFYQVPSGLVLYWLTNSVMSLLGYKLAKS